MARVKAHLLRRAVWYTKTHIGTDTDLWAPLCGRKGSYRTVTWASAPVCKECIDKWHELHPRAGLWTHVAGLEADDEVETRMDELTRENGTLRDRLDELERGVQTQPSPKPMPRRARVSKP